MDYNDYVLKQFYDKQEELTEDERYAEEDMQGEWLMDLRWEREQESVKKN